jgi:hypothetical protein
MPPLEGGIFNSWFVLRPLNALGFNSARKCVDRTDTMAEQLILDSRRSLRPVRDPLMKSSSYRLARWVNLRLWPIGCSLAFLVMGMAYMLEWNHLVNHVSTWAIGGDLWGIFRAAHYVGWGSPGGIYTPGNGVVAFPGMAVLLAPVAMWSGSLHLTESYGPWVLNRPTAALILLPVELVLASTVIFASDALAGLLGVSKTHRRWLCVAVAVVAWPTAAVWGHAEDSLAVTFAICALMAMYNQKWTSMGWLMGFGIVMQPLVALLLPLIIAASPAGQRLLVTVRSVALSAVLVGIAFLGDFADTYRSLVKQPTPPSINHATPWVSLAPKLTSGSVKTVHGVSLVPGLGHPAMTATTARVAQVVEVAGGPGRMIDVLLVLLLGVYVWRRPQPTVRLLWLAALVLASRCFFEPVMTPYYLAPPLFLGLLMASRQDARRFGASMVLAVEITVFAYFRLAPWAWWLPVVAGLAGIVALGFPSDLAGEIDPLAADQAVEWVASPPNVDSDSRPIVRRRTPVPALS